MKRLGSRLFVVGAVSGILVLMNQVYLTQFSDLFPGVGFPVAQRDAWISALGWGLTLLPTAFLPLSVRRPSQMLSWTAYLMIIVPTAAIGAHSELTNGAYIAMVITVVTGQAILSLAGIVPVVTLPRLRIGRGWFWGGLGLLAVFFYAVLYREYGSMLHFANWKQVYAQRVLWMAASGGLLAGYGQNWLANAINPFLMAYGIARRRWGVFAIGAVLEAALFLIAAQRSMLVAPLLLLGVYLLLLDDGARFGTKISAGTLVLWVIPLVVVFERGLWSRAVAEIVYYRTFVNNGLLSAYYFDFFATHPQVHFSAVKGFSTVFGSPYTISYKEALSWHFFGIASDPNAHVLADGFAQFGYAGALIETTGLATALWLLDCVASTKRLPLAFVCVAAAMQVNNVANGQMPNFLTGEGYLALLSILYFMPYESTKTHVPDPDRRDGDVPAGQV